LIVGGTQGSDHIIISPSGAGTRVQILGGDTPLDQTFQGGISRIEVYTQGGNNHVEIDSAVSIPAFVFAGDGNDHLQGGGGSAVLVGAGGNDSITGGASASILIGSSGNDHLVGASGSDLLIGGSSVFDANIAALKALLAEWTRTDANYNQKVADITGGTTGGLNGSYFLNTATVFDDGSPDNLDGAGGGLNLYFARLAGTNKDHLGHLNTGEVVINI
jgi:Ca2+-binding RTX toxin-like protein